LPYKKKKKGEPAFLTRFFVILKPGGGEEKKKEKKCGISVLSAKFPTRKKKEHKSTSAVQTLPPKRLSTPRQSRREKRSQKL